MRPALLEGSLSLRLADNVRLREIEADGSFWAFDVESGSHYELSQTGFEVFQRLGRNEELPMIVEAIALEYDVEPDSVRKDVAKLVTEALAIGVITGEDKT